MPSQELRAHLRIQSESRAIIVLPDGSRIKCEVRDISLGGAYLLRSTEFGSPAVLAAGDQVRVWVFHPGRAHEGPTVDAEIVRVEPNGGAGIALRFALDMANNEEADALVEHVIWEAEAQKIERARLGVPKLNYSVKTYRNVRRALGPVFNVALVLAAIGALSILKNFLDAVF